ncbi:hypothetical protein [Flavobacterium sp. UBA7680]|uniref:hypothetical protein n=1 Tax=Flavobacterium sp. UBA7680 TaxID=1946559 RepID=UPI0025C5E09E|nr:hypothetical protein [Flavobacterium sp. UBA7680]
MEKSKYKIILIAFFVIFIGLIVFVFCFKDEKVQTLKRYYSDSEKTYVHQYIIRNGDTILHGDVIVYNKKGIKVAKGNLINNVPKGEFIYYYDNGKIESIKYVLGNKKDAEYLWNYPNGKIEKYVFFNDLGEPYFIISYDEKGPTQYEGPTIKNIYHKKFNSKKHNDIQDNQYFRVGDTLIHQYLVANIPNAKRSFTVENVGNDNVKVKRTITPKPPTTIDVKEILTKKGKNTIRAVVKYEFKDDIVPAINDTLSFDVEVH